MIVGRRRMFVVDMDNMRHLSREVQLLQHFLVVHFLRVGRVHLVHRVLLLGRVLLVVLGLRCCLAVLVLLELLRVPWVLETMLSEFRVLLVDRVVLGHLVVLGLLMDLVGLVGRVVHFRLLVLGCRVVHLLLLVQRVRLVLVVQLGRRGTSGMKCLGRGMGVLPLRVVQLLLVVLPRLANRLVRVCLVDLVVLEDTLASLAHIDNGLEDLLDASDGRWS